MIQGVKNPKAGIVAIDLHRGHLDPAVATMPLEADAAARVVAANERLFKQARAAGIPVFHCVAIFAIPRKSPSTPPGAIAAKTRTIRARMC